MRSYTIKFATLTMNNATEDVNCPADEFTDLPVSFRLLEKVIYPILLVICTTGNVFVMCVWGRQFRQCSTNVYLVSMALLCVLYLWLEFPVKLLAYYPASDYMNEDLNHLQNFVICIDGARLWASYTIYNSIDWILILYSLERLIAVIHPLWIYKWMQPSYAVVAVGLIFFLASIQNMELAVYYYNWLPTAVSDIPYSELVPQWLATWDNVTAEAQLVLSISVYSSLTIINGILLMQLYRNRNKSVLLRDESSASKAEKAWSNKSSTQVLIGCSLLYLLCHLPIIVQSILETLASSPYCLYTFPGNSRVIWYSIANHLSYCDYTFKFVVYCAFSQRFRKALRLLTKKLLRR